jgi:hypothetical protein
LEVDEGDFVCVLDEQVWEVVVVESDAPEHQVVVPHLCYVMEFLDYLFLGAVDHLERLLTPDRGH